MILAKRSGKNRPGEAGDGRSFVHRALAAGDSGRLNFNRNTPQNCRQAVRKGEATSSSYDAPCPGSVALTSAAMFP